MSCAPKLSFGCNFRRLNEVESRLGERLNDLEAQLKSLQHLRVPPQFPEPQQRLPPPTVRSQGLPPAPTPSPAHFYSPQPPTPRSNSIPHPLRPFNPQPHSNSTPHHSFPPHQQQSHPQVAYPQHQSFRASSCASQHTSPADSSTSYRKRGSESGLDEVQLESTLKRIKVAAPVSSPRGAVSDFIARGEIDRDVAFLCFESFVHAPASPPHTDTDDSCRYLLSISTLHESQHAENEADRNVQTPDSRSISPTLENDLPSSSLLSSLSALVHSLTPATPSRWPKPCPSLAALFSPLSNRPLSI